MSIEKYYQTEEGEIVLIQGNEVWSTRSGKLALLVEDWTHPICKEGGMLRMMVWSKEDERFCVHDIDQRLVKKLPIGPPQFFQHYDESAEGFEKTFDEALKRLLTRLLMF